MARVLDEDEPIEHWTLIGDELDLLVGRTGPSKLGLASHTGQPAPQVRTTPGQDY